jgi:hypothetical protein
MAASIAFRRHTAKLLLLEIGEEISHVGVHVIRERGAAVRPRVDFLDGDVQEHRQSSLIATNLDRASYQLACEGFGEQATPVELVAHSTKCSRFDDVPDFLPLTIE